MPTSVHLPRKLVEALDARAKALGTSRNALIVRAVERELGVERGWPVGFFEWLRDVDDDSKASVDEMLNAITSRRSSKGPVKL